jgi:hypothetical protein
MPTLSRPLRLLAIAIPLVLATPGGSIARTPSPPADGPTLVASADSAGSPGWIVQRFFDRDGWPGRARYYTGEMARYAAAATLGAHLPPGATVRHRVLLRERDRTVIASTLSGVDRENDWYAYLYRDAAGWKLGEIRTLALPPLFYELMRSLSGETTGDPAQATELAEMRLTASPDSALKGYFAAKQTALRQLADAFRAAPALTRVTRDGDGGASGAPSGIVSLLRRLHVASVERQPEHPGCVFVVIGGMLDNSVGYLHAPPGCAVPAMSPHGFILVEPIAPGWYLYKST